ncbi:MAG TPA: sigma-70 family RNA polymerase sigma factor [Ktedonobacteraceae bacterium]|jgi:predicted DNA-binding protein (UPF0251 family)|nr:sigma-70 family RNA polymerase sigma factor [Ktedonobacteraceae bacterium]
MERNPESLPWQERLIVFFNALPEYGSPAFWKVVEEVDSPLALPLEVLVRCVRVAMRCGDEPGRNRLIEVILRRVQGINERWVQQVLGSIDVPPHEREQYAADLYADLCESMIRALLDSERHFWEEHFLHCLRYERKHVYSAFMIREGHWKRIKWPMGESDQTARTASHADRKRIPRIMLESLERRATSNDELIDEQAQQAFFAVEESDVARLVMYLPEHLRSVIFLVFWEEKTAKEAAHILGVSDRTVRNRLQDALNYLRHDLQVREVPGAYEEEPVLCLHDVISQSRSLSDVQKLFWLALL